MNFSDSLRTFSSRTMEEIGVVKRSVAIALFNAVVLDTPVLSGRLRGNWRFSLNKPDRTVNEDVDRTGSVAFNLMTTTFSASKGDDSLEAANSLPYAARIEYEGWSHTKAPQGMVRKNVVRFRRLLQDQLKK